MSRKGSLGHMWTTVNSRDIPQEVEEMIRGIGYSFLVMQKQGSTLFQIQKRLATLLNMQKSKVHILQPMGTVVGGFGRPGTINIVLLILMQEGYVVAVMSILTNTVSVPLCGLIWNHKVS